MNPAYGGWLGTHRGALSVVCCIIGFVPEAVNPVDNVRIVFDDVGEGEPLVLVHGSGLSKAIWRGFGYTKVLREQYRVITVDMRGHGRSDKPHSPADYAMPLVVADVLAVLAAAGVPAAHYFGYSFGARVGFSVAHLYPEKLLSFISAGGTFRSPSGSVGELFFATYDAALASGGMPAFIEGWGAAAGHPIDPATTAAFLANDAVALRAYFQQLENQPGLTEDIVPTIQTRTLLLAGTRDRRRMDDSRFAAQAMPTAKFHELPGRDHGTTLIPAGEVLAEVVPFLANL